MCVFTCAIVLATTRCLLSRTRLDTFAFMYDLTIKIIVIISNNNIKKIEGFDDRVRLRVNGKDRFFSPSPRNERQKKIKIY